MSKMSEEELLKIIELILTANMPIHREHAIDKRNILNGIKPFIHSYTQEKCREAKISILGGVKIMHRDTRTEIVSIVDGAILPIDERIAELQAQLNKSKGE